MRFLLQRRGHEVQGRTRGLSCGECERGEVAASTTVMPWRVHAESIVAPRGGEVGAVATEFTTWGVA